MPQIAFAIFRLPCPGAAAYRRCPISGDVPCYQHTMNPKEARGVFKRNSSFTAMDRLSIQVVVFIDDDESGLCRLDDAGSKK
jgi:hypothetical protein